MLLFLIYFWWIKKKSLILIPLLCFFLGVFLVKHLNATVSSSIRSAAASNFVFLAFSTALSSGFLLPVLDQCDLVCTRNFTGDPVKNWTSQSIHTPNLAASNEKAKKKSHRNLIHKDCLKRYNFPINQNKGKQNT